VIALLILVINGINVGIQLHCPQCSKTPWGLRTAKVSAKSLAIYAFLPAAAPCSIRAIQT